MNGTTTCLNWHEVHWHAAESTCCRNVNDHMQTTNPRIYAAVDICSKFKFAHAADFQARIVIQNALFAVGPTSRPRSLMSACTNKTPRNAGIELDTYVQHFSDVDRAILEGQDDGFVKVQT